MANTIPQEVTLAEAAAIAQRCENTIRRAISDGRLLEVRRWGRVLVLRSEVQQLFPVRATPMAMNTNSAPTC